MQLSSFIKNVTTREWSYVSKIAVEGGVRYTWFLESSRYGVDFAADFKSEGWQQFDTDQDAWYFGVWVNPSKRMTLTYAEGDWSLCVYGELPAYLAAVGRLVSFYAPGRICTVVDANGVTEYRQDRSKFLAGDLTSDTIENLI